MNKKSIQKTWDYRSYFLLSFSGWHSIVVMHGGWFVPFFSFFSCGFFFGRKDDKRQNNRTILTIKDYKKRIQASQTTSFKQLDDKYNPQKVTLSAVFFHGGLSSLCPKLRKDDVRYSLSEDSIFSNLCQ